MIRQRGYVGCFCSGRLGRDAGNALLDQVQNVVKTLRNMNVRQLLMQALSFGMIVASALIIWKSLMLVSGSESPIVVVLSGSMEPAIQRGDLVFLTLWNKNVVRGDITVYQLPRKEIPIVHRIVHSHSNAALPDKKGKAITTLLTKGDANPGDDIPIFWDAMGPNMKWLNTKHLIGVGRAYVPLIGMVTIMMNDYPLLKYLMIGGLALMVLIGNKEQ